MSWGATTRGTEGLSGDLLVAVELGTQRGLNALGIKGAELVQENIRTPYNGLPPAVCFENLVSNIGFSFVREASICREIIGVSPSVQAFNYAAPVETGARPHMPPAAELVSWVKKKFGIEDEKQATSIAFAVSKNISKRGTQGHEMFSRALEALEPLAPDAMTHNLAVAFAEYGFPVRGAA